jgi:shikimate kinase
METQSLSPDWPSRIYLMGFMGSGKSGLGAKLARRLQYEFRDLDALITEREGRAVTEIFAESGEAYFRKAETEVLHGTGTYERTLIALGGGTPCFGQNMDWISRNGWSIYLRIPVDTLLGRLRKRKDSRPLLASLNDDDMRAYIERTLEQRRPYYERADVILDAENLTPEQSEAALRGWLQNQP